MLPSRLIRSAIPLVLVRSVPIVSRPIAFPLVRTLRTVPTHRFNDEAPQIVLKPTPPPSLFQSREGIETRIHRLIFDLFHNKLESSQIYEHTPATPSHSAEPVEPVFRVEAMTPFKELGLDSLDLVELMVAVEQEFHVEFTDEEHAAVTNVEDIIAKIHGHPKAY